MRKRRRNPAGLVCLGGAQPSERRPATFTYVEEMAARRA